MSSLRDKLNALAKPQQQAPEKVELRPVALDVEVLDYRSKPAGTMFGFADFKLSLSDGCTIELYDCALHEKDNQQWINPPSKQYKKRDGSNGYSKLIVFDPSLMAVFMSTAFARLEEYVAGANR